MSQKCKVCGSYAVNPHLYDRDNTDLDLCDVHYWQKRADDAQRDAERLMFAFEADGFVNVQQDRYDYAMDCAEEGGRDEPNAEDELNGVRRLIDAAMAESAEAMR